MLSSRSSLASAQLVRAPRWLPWTAGGVPLAYYVASASAYGGLYEEGTFIAAARSLGVPHPPGAPLTSLTSAFFALLPVGPLSFRVAVASAVFAAITLALFSRALFFTLLGAGARSQRQAALLALAASWFAGQTPLFVQQATRANVYAVQFALALLVIDALVRFELSEPSDDRRTLYFAAFVQGLSFANHHVFALLMLAPAAPTLGRVLARRGFLGLMGHVALPILGFSAYVYVPIRGGRHPFINIGDPSSLLRSLWVLSADPWWGPSDVETPSALAQLSAGLSTSSSTVALVLLGLAASGFLLAARAASPRRFAVLWLIALLVPFASIAWIIEPKLTSDAWGALVPCALALVALATTAVALAFQQLPARFEQALSSVALGLAGGALLALVLRVEGRGLARFRAPDALADLGRRALPTRALVLTRDAGTWFRALGAEAEEQLRADVTIVPLAFLDYPKQREALLHGAPELGPVLGALAESGSLAPQPVRALAALRPLYVELDDEIGAGLTPLLTSDGLFERVADGELPLDPRAREARERARFARLYARLGSQARSPELPGKLARLHRRKALVLAAVGAREAALMHVRLGLKSEPNNLSMLRLESALSTATRPLPPHPARKGEP